MTTVNDSMNDVARNVSGKRALLDRLFTTVSGPGFVVNYWDGTQTRYGGGEVEFTVDFKEEPSLLEMLSAPSLFFGEAYMRGEIEISGSYSAVARALNEVARPEAAGIRERIFSKALAGLSSVTRSIAQQKKDIAAHYDIGNSFFALWLDKQTRSYSCAYYRDGEDSLDAAQQRKIDLILRKLHLEPGMRVLDIGCGWGGLSISAARDYGVKVLGITLSEEQASAVRQRHEEHGVADACAVRLCNYLELPAEERFDRIVSVGMFEHVGLAHHRDYFGKIRDLLKPAGLSLLHTLTKDKPGETDPWIAKRIFPGGRIPAVFEIVTLLPDFGFHLLHAESLRRHYVKTLNAWYDNFSRPEVLATVRGMFDQAFIRMWSLYLRMASAFLAVGSLDVHQFVFSKGINDDLPMTLESVYGFEKVDYVYDKISCISKERESAP